MSELNNHFDCAVCGLTNKDFKFYGIGECNHPICGVCAIKLAKFSKDCGDLYDYSKCVICKQHMSKIVISSKINSFDQFNEKAMIFLEQYGLFFDGNNAQRFYYDVVRIQCKKCHTEFISINELIEHVSIHNYRYCTLCVQFNKCLPSEFVLMTDNDFHHHNTKQHPKCPFCNKRYYDNTHLIKHAKESHFLCDICNRMQGFVAYNTQSELLKHFVDDHHVCETCRSVGNINVFDTEYNLKTHRVLEHDNKGLVSEGLVNIKYGDSNNRYASRRRARDNNEDDLFNGASVEITEQQLPEMECVEEFPPLNGEVSQKNKQLGMKSVTNDENDARGAFTRNNGHQEDITKSSVSSSVTTITKNKEVMSTNVAFSCKRSIGNLNDNDFPCLSSDTRVPNSHNLEYNKVKNLPSNRDTNIPKKNLNINEDFPSLSGKNVKVTSMDAPKWQHSVTTNHSNKAVKSVSTKKAPSQHIQSVREPSPDNCAEVDMELERELAYKSKIQFMSHDEFKQINSKNQVASRPLPPPIEADFPVLGNAQKTDSTTSKTVVGAWGEYNVQTQKPKENKVIKPESFASNGPLDFPELPFKVKPVSTGGALNNKQKNKPNKPKKDNFAAAAASSNVMTPKSNVYSLKSVSDNLLRGASSKSEAAVSYNDANDSIYAHKQPSSTTIRGLDYVPHVVPTNENVVLVDSKAFADLKNAKPTSNMDHKELPKNYENDFPSVDGCVPRASATNSNHFTVLQDTSYTSDMLDREKKSATKHELKVAPKLNSNADFPTLEQNKPSVSVAVKTQRSKPKKESTKKVESSVPGISLADIALSVTNKNYTPFPDTDNRNQALFETVHLSLDPQLAQRFLSLSSLYRNRKITIRAYLDAINDDFSGQTDFITELLPQMLVLLPDISLQKCLFGHMPKQWTVTLRECLKCGQIVTKADIEAHNVVAHG